jgi:hypothetical protein
MRMQKWEPQVNDAAEILYFAAEGRNALGCW